MGILNSLEGVVLKRCEGRLEELRSLSMRTFEVFIISVVKFLVTCSVSEILEDKKG